MKIYIVIQPEYDCEIIHGVFSSRELARAAVDNVRKIRKWIGLIIEEFDLDVQIDRLT